MSQVRKDVLNGWKEIAAYLGRDPRTVERWEKQRFLPVRRLPGSGRATVYALVTELDAWLASSPLREADPYRQIHSPDEAQGEPSALAPAPGREDRQRGDEGATTPGMVAATDARAGKPFVGDGVGSLRSLVEGHRTWALLTLALVVLGTVGLLVTRRAQPTVDAGGRWVPPGVRPRPHMLVPSSSVAGVEQLYMRGCYQTEQRTPESLRHAQEAFRSAIARDPHYAPAFAGLASTFLLLREYATMPDAEAYPAAQKAASEALERDPDLPQAHAVLGFVEFFWDWRAQEAESEFQKALRLDPELALSHHWYGSMLTHEGRFQEGVQELETAQRLEPSSAAILTTRALALGLGGHRSEGINLLEEALSSDRSSQFRNPSTMHNVLGLLSLLPPRDIPRYLSETMIAAELRQDDGRVTAMRRATEAYRRHGEAAMWQELLQQERRSSAGKGPTYAMARFEAEVGARDQALNDLAELYSRHDPALIGLTIDPLFAPLHGEPRFGQLRSAMGLPEMAQN